MNLKKRIDQLEQQHPTGLVIFFADDFDDKAPVIRSALIDGRTYERGNVEAMGVFETRIGASGKRSVILEESVHDL